LTSVDVIATLSLDFNDDLRLSEVEKIANRIETTVNERYSEVSRIFISPKSRFDLGPGAVTPPDSPNER
jgi:divalent metal cation (Fe/Co/Zn/Cd) transporter